MERRECTNSQANSTAIERLFYIEKVDAAKSVNEKFCSQAYLKKSRISHQMNHVHQLPIEKSSPSESLRNQLTHQPRLNDPSN